MSNTNGCYKKKICDTGDYTLSEKFSHPSYVFQNNRLQHCLKDLSLNEKKALNETISLWSERAENNLSEILTKEQSTKLKERRFIDCFKIIATDKASKKHCKKFIIHRSEIDFLTMYAIREHERCSP
ncbi:hypothetical protein COBT_001797 [Conglomerata obtusa]